ncbi:MAG: DUF692 family protein, partial [Flavobacteriales bacterium]|nr:DUF692 family protein [Flavobacteriales bacterium]
MASTIVKNIKAPVAAEMSEIDFVNAIVEQSDCQLLLDVNN